MKMRFCLKLASVLFAASVIYLAHSQQSCASGIAQQTCDTEVWKTMSDRAHLEAEREVMQNQNLIFKPDSILTYTCFDKMTAHASLFVGQLFTHTKYWNGTEIIKWGDNGRYVGMNTALQRVVIDSMKPYIEGSFKYSMLGGRGDDINAGDLGVKMPEDIPGKGDTYSCDQMNKVWKAAKCLNFIHNDVFAEYDGFYPFIGLEPVDGPEKIKGYDEIVETRQFPAALACSDETGKPIYNGDWTSKYHDSRNETETGFGDPNLNYKFGEKLDTTHTEVRKKIKPGECGTDTGSAIKTGIKVLPAPSGSTASYDDGVCTNPGCVYDKGGNCKAISGGGGGGDDDPVVD